MKKIFFRMFAYIIDVFILGIVLTFLATSVPVFKGNKVEELNKEYTLMMNEYMEIYDKSNEMLEDSIINEEEFNNIKEKYPHLSTTIEPMVGSEISKEDFNEKIYSYVKKVAKESDYKVNKISIYKYVLELALTILYFGVLQFYLKGQTVGKKLFKLFVVNEDEETPSLQVLMIRSLFTSTIVLSLINSILALSLSYKGYSSIYSFITSLPSLYMVIMFSTMVFREDGRGLHDLLLKTKVKLLNEETKEEVKTLEYKEKENEKSTNKTNRNVSKRSSK